jgi:hypothetical protein
MLAGLEQQISRYARNDNRAEITGQAGADQIRPIQVRPIEVRPIALLQTLAERLNRRRFVVLYFKNGVKLGDLQQVVHFLGEVEQF